MPNTLLTIQDREESLSRAYAHAVAAKAGYVLATYDLDRDGIDLGVRAGGPMRPALDLQLKATVNLGEPQSGFYSFPLRVHNYDSLRIETQTPRLLVVLDLPEGEDQWLTITATELTMRRRAYWLNLRGYEESANTASVTVRIPVQNVFDVENLHSLMEQSRQGGIL